MPATTNYKKGDQLPEYTAQLIQGQGLDAEPINLTGTTVKLHMTNRSTGAVKVNSDATIDAPATDGKVRYVWGATDLDTPGNYDVEWEITFSGDRKMTVPSKDFDMIVVREDGD